MQKSEIDIADPEKCQNPVNDHRELLARISLKENKLRNLRLLDSYRNRGDYEAGEENIKTWKKALREALVALHSEHPDPKPPMQYFVTSLGIDPEIIGFHDRTGTFSDLT